jgi:hypothetical protein
MGGLFSEAILIDASADDQLVSVRLRRDGVGLIEAVAVGQGHLVLQLVPRPDLAEIVVEQGFQMARARRAALPIQSASVNRSLACATHLRDCR